MGEKWNFEGGVRGWSLKGGIMIQPPASYITLTSPSGCVGSQSLLTDSCTLAPSLFKTGSCTQLYLKMELAS